MTGDSLDLPAAGLLFAACCFAFSTRGYLRFGAVLFSAFAVAAAAQPALGLAAALLVMPLGGIALALAAFARFARPLPPLPASALLATGLGLGLAALLTGDLVFALLPLALCGIAVMFAALHRLAFAGALSGSFLCAGACAFAAQGARGAVSLFLAAALLGLAQPRRSSSAARFSTQLP